MTTDASTEQDVYTIIPGEGNSGAWAELKAGMYAATLASIEDAGISTMYPADGPRYKLGFEMTGLKDDNGDPIVLHKWVSQKITDGKMQSNLLKYAQALGLPPVKGQPYRVKELIGRPCQVFVNVKDSEQGPRPFVAEVVPANNMPGPAAAAAPAPLADICRVEGCEAERTKFTAKATPLCDAHTAEDL